APPRGRGAPAAASVQAGGQRRDQARLGSRFASPGRDALSREALAGTAPCGHRPCGVQSLGRRARGRAAPDGASQAGGRPQVIVPDLNLLIYAYRASAAEHKKARAWWEKAVAGGDVGLALPALFGFIRLSTNPRVFTDPLPV